ncbi:MAG: thioredoxin family protein [bacterium]
MNRKSSLLVILLVFALPVLLYYVTRAPKESISSAALAEATNQPKVLHFSQTMCSECRKLAGYYGSIEQEYKGKVLFVDIDVADGTPATQSLMQKYNVRVVPTLVFINKNGKIVKVTEGAIPKEEIERCIDSIIK